MFVSDEDIVLELCKFQSVSYVACKLGTVLSRVREIRDAHKTKIVTARLQAGQTIEGIAFQLDLVPYLDRMRDWVKRVNDLKQAQEQEQAHAQD